MTYVGAERSGDREGKEECLVQCGAWEREQKAVFPLCLSVCLLCFPTPKSEIECLC